MGEGSVVSIDEVNRNDSGKGPLPKPAPGRRYLWLVVLGLFVAAGLGVGLVTCDTSPVQTASTGLAPRP